MTADLIDNINDWVRLSIEIPLEARLSSWLPSVLENQLLETRKSTNARLNHKRVRVPFKQHVLETAESDIILGAKSA